MKTNAWGKTILTIYRYLERIAGAIDKLVERQALNSYYYFKENTQNNGVLNVAEKIIELSERKVRLINIKVLTEESLKKCDRKLAELLIYRYIDGDRSEDIAKRLDLSERTYFRRLNQAEDQFLHNFAVKGFSENKLTSYLKEEKWIMEVFNKFNDQRKELDEHELNFSI